LPVFNWQEVENFLLKVPSSYKLARANVIYSLA